MNHIVSHGPRMSAGFGTGIVPAAAMPLPELPINVRPGTMEDLSFVDGLQKMHTKQVGWMPTAQFEGKIKAGHLLVAERQGGERLGYLIGNDQYFKRDDVGIIYQINVVPGVQRGLIGATLLKAQFERSAWGCKLYCCWCAQDIAANHFWQAMGFVPLAFRTGSAKKDRVHIFWQKRIRAGDEQTPWWFPSQTTGGAIRSDRIVLPIPPGVRWWDEMPRVLPGVSEIEPPAVSEIEPPANPAESEAKALASTRKRKTKHQAAGPVATAGKRSLSQTIGGWGSKAPVAPEPVAELTGLRMGPAPAPAAVAENPPPAESPKPRRKQQKNDPTIVAAARELRDRWLEAANRGECVALPRAKYDVARIPAPMSPTKLLAA